MCSLHRKGFLGNFFFCGASIIDDRWLMTAAHCVTHEQAIKIEVRCGDAHNDHDDGGIGQVLNVSSIHVHENYSSSGFADDIALLQLSSDIKFADNSQPVCLPAMRAEYDGLAEISGWGQTQSCQTSRLLLAYGDQILNNTECIRRLSSSIFVPSKMICIDDGRNRTACYGDSGSAVVKKVDRERYVQVGIVSFGEPGCTSVSASTKVSTYIEWIDSIMNGIS